jgi:hypothetical protein
VRLPAIAFLRKMAELFKLYRLTLFHQKFNDRHWQADKKARRSHRNDAPGGLVLLKRNLLSV